MSLWVTEIKAIRVRDGELITYCGPNVPGISFATAQQYCEENGLGYCKVIGKLVATVDYETGKQTDYDTPELN